MTQTRIGLELHLVGWLLFLSSLLEPSSVERSNVFMCTHPRFVESLDAVTMHLQVYPTSQRAVGLGAASSMARLGAIATPFVAQVASGTSLYIPIVVYTLAAIVGVFASLWLPIETKGRQLE